MTVFRLGSSPAVYAPGLVKWAINGYAFEKDREVLSDIITETWAGVTKEAAHALLTKQVPFTVEDEVVVFTVEESNADHR